MAVYERDPEVWASMTRNLGTDSGEKDRWTCQTVIFLGAILLAGIVALLLAQTWLPIFARAVLVLGVFGGVLFAGQGLCGGWRSAMAVIDDLEEKNPITRPQPPKGKESAAGAAVAGGGAAAAAQATGSEVTGGGGAAPARTSAAADDAAQVSGGGESGTESAASGDAAHAGGGNGSAPSGPSGDDGAADGAASETPRTT
jgi:hypothetical protein